MHDWQSLTHVRWDCKYHVVIVPKYRKKELYGKRRKRIGDGDRRETDGTLLTMLNYVFDSLPIALEMAEVVTPS